MNAIAISILNPIGDPVFICVGSEGVGACGTFYAIAQTIAVGVPLHISVSKTGTQRETERG